MPGYGPMPGELETDRLSLQLRDRDDAEWNLRLLGERDGGTNFDFDDVQRRLEDQAATARQVGFGLYTIRRRVGGGPIGYAGLVVGRSSIDEPELAYELLRAFHGQGYATEAARAVMDAALATGRERLWSTVGAWNAPSLRVLEKLGFEHHHAATLDQGDVIYLVRQR